MYISSYYYYVSYCLTIYYYYYFYYYRYDKYIIQGVPQLFCRYSVEKF